jgi:hypothetical protein
MESQAAVARVLEKSLDLLCSFQSHDAEQSPVQISRNLGFLPSTVGRLLILRVSRRRAGAGVHIGSAGKQRQ